MRVKCQCAARPRCVAIITVCECKGDVSLLNKASESVNVNESVARSGRAAEMSEVAFPEKHSTQKRKSLSGAVHRHGDAFDQSLHFVSRRRA